jgi:hypothetical protein
MAIMPIFPRPVSPKNAAGDLWGYLRERRAHRWPLLGVSAGLTWAIVWLFVLDANTNTMPKQNQIQYFENWRANRSDIAVILQQKKDLADRVAAIHAKQKEMQKVADMFGIEWREEARRNAAREAEAVRILNARLDKRLAEAQAKLDAAKPLSTPSQPTPSQPTPAQSAAIAPAPRS